MFKIRFVRLGIALAVGCMMLTVGTTIWAFDGAKNISVIYRNIGMLVNGVEVKTTQGEPFIYEGRTYVPLRSVAEALGTEVSWDGQGNKVHINGKVNLDGQVYIKTVTARPQTDNDGYTNVFYTVMLVNATDRNLSGLSVTCKGLAKDGRLLDTVASNFEGVMKSHTSQASQFMGRAAKMGAPIELTAMCELGTPMG